MISPYQPRSVSDTLPAMRDFNDALQKLQSQMGTYNPAKIVETVAYDTKKLDTVTNIFSEEVESTIQNAVLLQNKKMREDQMNKVLKNTDRNVNPGDKSEGDLLAMILGIVSIGVNIAKKGKTIAAGFKEVPMGIGSLLVNLAIMTVMMAFDSFVFICQLCYYLFKLLICSVDKILSFPKCILFYIMDIIAFVILMTIVSLAFIIDLVLMIKYWFGVGFVDLIFIFLSMLEQLDKTIYTYSGIHIIHYPKPIIQLCYKCDAMGNTDGFKRAAKKMFNNVFVALPTSIGDPINQIVTGIGHIFDMFILD